jgi:DNA-binding helix-hairpin-helix protein with protein kinase domain
MKRELQLKGFLRKQFLEDASIKGIGPGRISVLRSFGIETALDVTEDRVNAVAGFGPALTAAVVDWRKSVEARFRFDPAKGIEPAERAALTQRQSQRRAALESSLTTGLNELQQIRLSGEHIYETHRQRYAAAYHAYERAFVAAQVLFLPRWAA